MCRWTGSGLIVMVPMLVIAGGLAPVCAQPVPPTTTEVAGLQPDRRPAQAPRLSASAPDAATIQRRLKGVEAPWPGNVGRIAAQGAWYSPMFAPGMTGRYDLRGWHAASPTGGAAP